MKTDTSSVNGDTLKSILKRHGVVEAYVFGSFARGTDIRPQSDIDLLVTYKPGTTLFDVIDLQNELEKTLGRKVDLISQKSISNRLAKRIKKEIRPINSVL